MQDQMPKYINYVPKYDYSELKRIWNIGKTTLQNKTKTIAKIELTKNGTNLAPKPQIVRNYPTIPRALLNSAFRILFSD